MSGSRGYLFSVEIAQMCYVFNEIRNPPDQVVQYIEDVVRHQLNEIIIDARSQAMRRGSRVMSVEDVLFHMRHDRARVQRLRTYLSWKDVRKKVRDSEQDDSAEPDLEEPSSDKSLKALRQSVPMTWDLFAMYSEFLDDDSLANSDEDALADLVDAQVDIMDELDEDEQNKARLRHADAITSTMTKEQYLHYSECRQASFTYRRAKRFRDFLSIGSSDVNFSDEVTDALGFIAYEIVGILCSMGITHKKNLHMLKTVYDAKLTQSQSLSKSSKRKRDSADGDEEQQKDGSGDVEMKDGDDSASTRSNAGQQSVSSSAAASRKRKSASSSRTLAIPTSLFSEPETPVRSGYATPVPAAAPPLSTPATSDAQGGLTVDPSDIGLEDLHNAYVAMQNSHAAFKSAGMRNWRSTRQRLRLPIL